MSASLIKIIGGLLVLVFLIINLFYKGDRNRLYLKFVILTLPFIGVKFIPNIDAFTGVSVLFFLFFHERNDVDFFENQLYKFIVYSLFLSILIGFYVADIKPDLETIIHYFRLIPVFLYTSLIIRETSDDIDFFYEFISWIRLILIFSFVFLCAQFIFGPKFSLSGTLRPNVLINDGVRYPSFLADPQHYSQFVSVMCFISLVKPLEKKYGYKDLLLVLFSLIAIMSSGGRSGLMGFLLGFTLIILFSKGYYKFIFILVGIALYFVLLQFQDNFAIFKRGTDLDNAYAFRYSIWMEAFDIFKKNPFFGIGFDNYAKHVFLHNPNQFWLDNHELLPYDVPENGNLKLLTELGGVGFLFVYVFFLYPILSLLIYFLKRKDYNILLLFCSMLSFLFSFNGTYTLGEQRIFILMISIISCIISYKHLVVNNLTIIDDEEHDEENDEDDDDEN